MTNVIPIDSTIEIATTPRSQKAPKGVWVTANCDIYRIGVYHWRQMRNEDTGELRYMCIDTGDWLNEPVFV